MLVLSSSYFPMRDYTHFNIFHVVSYKNYILIHSNFYFSFYSTISTVGYGDVTAVSYLGRIVVIGLIVVSLAILPGLISETVETVNSNNTGRGTVVIGKNPFVVVCGVFDNVLKISDVLTAFLHQV